MIDLTEFLLARLAEDEIAWQMVASRDVMQTLRGQPLAPRMKSHPDYDPSWAPS